MYHHLKRINCQPLNKLNQLARITLAFGLEQELHDSKVQVRDKFIEHCKTQGFPKAGGWLWRKPTISSPLYKLVQLSLAEKQTILPAYDADVDLEAAFQKGQFAYFSIPTNNQPALKLVSQIMQNFYANILCSKEGIDADVLNESEKLTRQNVLHSFVVEQQGILMMVCPGCDGAPPEQEADGTIREDVDHFFPKSRYPFLTIHPLNLTPYCKHCNQDYKRAKDPLKSRNGIPSLTLQGIFHPYIHSSRDASKNSEVEIVVRREKGLPHVKILPSNQDLHHISRRESLDHLLSLQTRWDGALRANYTTQSFTNLLRVLIRKEIKIYTETNRAFIPDVNWLLQNLPIIVETIKDGIGEGQHQVAAYAYVKWLRTDPTAQIEWLNKLQIYVQ